MLLVVTSMRSGPFERQDNLTGLLFFLPDVSLRLGASPLLYTLSGDSRGAERRAPRVVFFPPLSLEAGG